MPKIKRSPDPDKPLKISKVDWEQIDAIVDSDIENSDPPEPGGGFFQCPRAKEKITVGFDRDMLDWFRSKGADYQTKMNAVLRAFYESSK